jgi:seryl-tRNA synthetase
MLFVPYLRENIENAIHGLEKRNFPNAKKALATVLELDANRKKTQASLDSHLAESNALSREIGALMKAGKKEEAENKKRKSVTLKEAAKREEEELNQLEDRLKDLLYTIPNIPNKMVPAGKSAEDNEVVTLWGEKPNLVDDALPHWELIKKYDIIDFELGNKISGAGFPVYKGKGARLQRALINFFLDEALKSGYTEIQPPIVVNEDSGYGTGQLPDKDGQMYKLIDENLYLIPTAEVPITNLYRDVILKEDELPIQNVGYTPCFRREAGSWGAHVRGLNRLHQFDKVEIVQIQHPDNSYKALDEMCEYVMGLLKKLNLHFRQLRLCAGDLGFTSSITYDMEVFSGGQKKWLEVSSVSNFETFQSNRLKLRFKDSTGKTRLVHTLNGSALALPRIMAAIIENNQSSVGIAIPEVLVDYTGFDKID